ncbi:MAG: diacylglycerol kinase [Pirellulales bacterium]
MTQERSWRLKFAVAFRGLFRAVRTESSFAVHLPVAAGVILLAALLRLPPGDWAALLLAIGGVLAAEVFNSALEAFARAPGQGRHPRIRDALDMASATVLVAAGTAVTVGAVVFVPRLVDLLRAGGG